MDKRTATVSSRIPAELEAQVQAIALARDVTVSDLICSALAEVVEQDLSGISQKNTAEGAQTPPAAASTPDR